jgi:hypothetical protein
MFFFLQARALWLVGACGTEFEREQWIDAWGLSVALLTLLPAAAAAASLHTMVCWRLLAVE